MKSEKTTFPQSACVLGVNSGTSADGIDLALCRLEFDGKDFTGVETLATRGCTYDDDLHDRIWDLQNGRGDPEELSRVSFVLGRFYGERIASFLKGAPEKPEVIALHGQTVGHFPPGYGEGEPATLQIGEPAVVARLTGIDVVSSFREADVAAGGQGAPLTPLTDRYMFFKEGEDRIVLNIGGICNATWLPGDGSTVTGFDTGPGNTLLDTLITTRMPDARYDLNGKYSKNGIIHEKWLSMLLSDEYLKRKPPKSTGQELYGGEYYDAIISLSKGWGLKTKDLARTLVRLTAQSARDGCDFFPRPAKRVIVAGGGSHNPTLMKDLRQVFFPAKVEPSSRYGIDPDYREAIAFAILAFLFMNRIPVNLGQITGSSGNVLPGRLTPHAP